VDFRRGNEPPVKDNLGFIQQCQQSLPSGCQVKALRIDAAGYQEAIIRYCDDEQIAYAIRAKSSQAMRDQIEGVSASDWQPLLDKSGQPIPGQDTYRTSFCIGQYEQAFTLVIQRKACRNQLELLDTHPEGADEIRQGSYVYRAIATNRDTMSDSAVIHWYNQRAEDSENRIKELKLDFGGDTLPCSDFEANALYFLISALSYNLFALMRHVLPEQLSRHRVLTIRLRVYAIAAKVVRTGRQLWVKLSARHRVVLEEMLMVLRGFKPPPI